MTAKHRTGYRKYSPIVLALCTAWIFSALIPGGSFPLSAQVGEKETLQQKKTEIEKEIEYTNKLLEETQKNRQASMNELAVINRKIDRREVLIQTISDELVILDRTILQNQQSLSELDAELKQLKDEYARMIYLAFLNRGAYDRLMFLFSSKNFNQAYQRMKYMQQYGDYRKQQAGQILEKQNELTEKTRVIEQQKMDKEALLSSKERELIRLDGEKNDKNVTLSRLGQKESELRKTLKEKEAAARKLQQALERIIAEEIRKSNEMMKTRAGESSATFALTPEERELSNSFASNMGKLPWPTERGVISSPFGEQAHPVLKGIKVKNNGIDILTNAGSPARAIFAGEVTRIIAVPKYHNVVIIRHGEFLSVYSNLDEVMVSKGEKIVTKQVIGSIHTDESSSRTELHFELWKGKELQDPLHWIAH